MQYLYCNSSAPHHLTNVYPLGATCANESNYTAIATFTHDEWGNESSRTYDGLTATLNYDQFNHLVEYSAGSNQEFYAYDTNGQRILKRSTSTGTTTLTVDVFGLDEYTYSGAGTLSGQLHSYSLAGHLIGSFDGTSIVFYLTDGLGSILLDFSASAILGEQLYGPYGNSRSLVGSLATSKGYTGQIHDALTGLDYYVARYYDPLVGIFLTVDTVQGNMPGFDPYAYVQGNPETMNDPTGQYFTDGSPYDRAVVESDTNGDGGHYVLVYIPSNHAAPSLKDEWVNYTHVNKKGEVDVVAGWADNGRRQVQCAFGCNSNNFVLGAAAIALDPAADAAATVVLAVVAITLIVGIIANAVTSASSTTTAYSWVNKPTEDGTTVKVRKLTDDEVSELEEFGQSFEEIKSDEGYPLNADIYVDKNGDYWIQPPRGKFLIPFPS